MRHDELDRAGEVPHWMLDDRGRVGTSAPTSGQHKRGEVVWNTAPAGGGYVGWVCVAAGRPGTWKTFGAITA